MSPTYKRKDHYYRKAKEEGLASRAVYKLEQIDRQFSLLKAGDRVLDLGCAPGGWLQYLAKKVGPSGRAVGVDLLEVKIPLPSHVTVLRGDATRPEIQEELIRGLEGPAGAGSPADLVVSDMSPNLSGIRFRDNYESHRLGLTVLSVAKKILKAGGSLVVKIFPGDELPEFKKQLKENFEEIKTYVPEATRKGSSEIYLIAKKFKA
jgi:23S rRNA (uridine2552-2'-O)-methyltransferase